MALISVSNNALSNITALPASIPTGALTLIKSITASASASISFVDGTDGVVLDGTYSSYVFKFIDINPDTDGQWLVFQGSTNNGTNYGVTITSTNFVAYHNETDSVTGLGYFTQNDLAQSTSFQRFGFETGNGADESMVGSLQLFNPSSTTYVKHFITRINSYHPDNYSADGYTSGYFNTTSIIDAMQFKMESGNFDGTIKLYGVK